MSVLGITGSSLFSYLTQSQKPQNPREQSKQELEQLGSDLKSGNLSAAQSDFAALQTSMPQSETSSTSNASQGGSPIAQAFSQLSTDLQSGNLSAAQSDYSTLQQDFQSMAAQGQSVHVHHHHHSDAGSDSSQSAISQLFSELGSALQSGNLSNAQQAYSSLQQDLLQMTQSSGTTSGAVASSSAGNVSVSA